MERIIAVHFPEIKTALKGSNRCLFHYSRCKWGKEETSTSELLDWIKLLLAEDIDPALREDATKAIPKLHGALLKNEQDVHMFERLAFMSRRQDS